MSGFFGERRASSTTRRDWIWQHRMLDPQRCGAPRRVNPSPEMRSPDILERWRRQHSRYVSARNSISTREAQWLDYDFEINGGLHGYLREIDGDGFPRTPLHR
jgi:hypothetical protein